MLRRFEARLSVGTVGGGVRLSFILKSIAKVQIKRIETRDGSLVMDSSIECMKRKFCEKEKVASSLPPYVSEVQVTICQAISKRVHFRQV